ncbi:hypothetical protein Q1695_013045 [Nippostrongylus brasiliensis]|nr:hypothetical protein Q1695_013045 [Nippostrongylus brasiliensis]
MKTLLGLFLISAALADDKLYCTKKCSQQYDEDVLKNACNFGCDARATVSNGPFDFIDCQRKCDAKFEHNNETAPNTRSACSYACMLPMTSSVFMSVKYGSGGKPEVKIVRNNNGFTSVEHPTVGSVEVDGLLNKIIRDTNRQFFSFPSLFESAKPDSGSKQGQSSTDDDIGADILGPAHAHMMAMQERMNHMMDAFSRHFFDGIRRDMHRNRHQAVERPADHDAFAHLGPEVGNLLPNGESIIVTQPVNGDDGSSGGGIKVVRYQLSSSHPPSVFYWIMIIFGIGALLLTMYASVIFFRVMRSAAYRRISGEGTTPSQVSVSPAGPGPLPVKKVPLDGWVERSEPSGVPPPAYDQVSIHSIQKQQKSSQEAGEPLPPKSNSPSDVQK